MQDLLFEWDVKKAFQNKQKHGVTFDEARTVFFDENGLLIHDPDHSLQEHRYILLGMSNIARLIVVSHCYRRQDSVIRIISARKATRSESLNYKQGAS